ncbi:DUF4132 domain-containing protein [Actinomadura sp. 9N407]|uniref:DUF4132 domain-containing protein n=1 Tax=Actinomadura sp. 9N407 TaxID=3375154 RepID=UPI0037AC24D8
MEDQRLPDENSLMIPDSWFRLLHPRRGGTVVPEITPTASAAKRIAGKVRKSSPRIQQVLESEKTDPELAARARAYLGGEADPLGAAVVGVLIAELDGWQDPRSACSFVDAWAAGHGVGFAACAFAHLGDLATYPRSTYSHVTHVWRNLGKHANAWWTGEQEAGRRLRTFLAAASDGEHRDAEAALAEFRKTPRQRLSAAYLMPARTDWVEECFADSDAHGFWWMLACSAGAEHAALVDRYLPGNWARLGDDIVATLVDGAGVEAVRLLREVAAGPVSYRGIALDALAVLPSDEAMEILVRLHGEGDRAADGPLLAAMERFPVRAIRLMARTGEDSGLLTAHLRLHRERVAELDEESRQAAEKLIEADGRVPDAPVDVLPSFLVDPPWLRDQEVREPIIIKLAPPAGATLHWAPGERERWGKDAPPAEEYREDVAAAFRLETQARGDARRIALSAPVDLVRPLLADWDPGYVWADDFMPPIVARFGADALPAFLRSVKEHSAENAELLMPVLDAWVARQMAEWARRRKTRRAVPHAWFERHGLESVPMLVPAALGKPGPARLDAESALRLVASAHGAEAVVAAAREYGDEAAGAVADLLAVDPMALRPSGRDEPERWASAHLFPQVLLRGGRGALPIPATDHLIAILSMSRPGEVHPGLEPVLELCDPESLAEFAWAVFEAWRAAGSPAAHSWALAQLGWLGDDETVRRLAPVIRAWPGEEGHHRAVAGLEVLAEIGSDVALLYLHGIAQKVKFKGLKARAQQKIEEVAAGLGLTAEQLADRLVPDFGLDEQGGMVLDYGPRRFAVGFDEQLKPYVVDEDGKRRKALPKPGAKDDPELAPAAYKDFAGLKKDVRTVAADQIGRLESAMVAGRRWTPGEFRDFFYRHPLMWHIARRLLWIAEDGGTATAFRIAEDRTFADVEDEALLLPEQAEIGMVHPVLLSAQERAAWAEVFADYEILQPFPQLGRGVHALTEEERVAGRLERFEQVTLPVRAFLGLVGRGWVRGVPQDAGFENWISKPVPGGLHVVVDLDPGITAGYIDVSGDQTLHNVWIDDRPTRYPYGRAPRYLFGALDAVTASEVLADLTALTGKNEGA